MSAYYGLGLGLGGAPVPIRGSHLAVGGLIEQYPGAAAAYSLRALRNNTGNVVRVRRSSDDTEQDFTAAQVSDGSLVDFANNGTSDLYGERMYFDGVDDNVTTTANAALSAASGDFFIEFNFLVPASNPAATQFLIEKGGQSNTVYDYNLRLNASGGIFGGIQKSATGAFSNVPVYSNLISDFGGEVVTVKLALESGTEKIYINGVRKDDTTISPGGNPATSDLSIGSSFAGGNYYAGLIYSVNINDQVAYQGYGNTDADWEDQIGSNDGTVNGSPALYSGQGFDGFVTTWYDQSGNSNDATQATTTAQPKIAENGSLLADGIKFDQTDDFLISSSSVLSGETFLTSSVQSLTSASGSGAGTIFAQYSAGTAGRTIFIADKDANDYEFFSQGTNAIVLNSSTISTDKKLFTVQSDGINAGLFRNGSSEDSDSTVEVSIQNIGFSIGGASDGSFPYGGSIEEIIVYTSDQSANRTSIEANIANAYGITLA